MTVTTPTAASIAAVMHETTPEKKAEVLTMYKRCSCSVAGPKTNVVGRACRLCFAQGWQKCCIDCFGLGTLHKAVRIGAQERVERCGKCMGVGWIPCPRIEIPLAEEEEKAILAGEDNPLLTAGVEADESAEAEGSDAVAEGPKKGKKKKETE